MATVSRPATFVIVAAVLLAMLSACASNTDVIEPHGWSKDSHITSMPWFRPDDSTYFREWNYIGKGDEADAVRDWLIKDFDFAMGHRAVSAGASGAEFHGVVNRWSGRDGRTAFVPAALYERGVRTWLLGPDENKMPTGHIRQTLSGGLAPVQSNVPAPESRDALPEFAWLVWEGSSLQWHIDPALNTVKSSELSGNLPLGPLVTALAHTRREVILVAGGPHQASRAGHMNIHWNQAGTVATLTAASGTTKVTLVVRLRDLGEQGHMAALVDGELEFADGTVRWLSRLSFGQARREEAGDPREMGWGLWLPDGGYEFYLDGSISPRPQPVDRETALARARYLMLCAMYGGNRMGMTATGLGSFAGLGGSRENVKVHWVKDTADIPDVKWRSGGLIDLRKVSDNLASLYGDDLEALGVADRGELRAILQGIGRDPTGAADSIRGAIWIPEESIADTHLLAHELAHVLAVNPWIEGKWAPLDQLLAHYLYDEGATECRARRMLGWPRIEDTHIVPVDTSDTKRMVLDLAYGYAPAALNGALPEHYEYRGPIPEMDEVSGETTWRRQNPRVEPFETVHLGGSRVGSASASVLAGRPFAPKPTPLTDGFVMGLGAVPLMRVLHNTMGPTWDLVGVVSRDWRADDSSNLKFNEAGFFFQDIDSRNGDGVKYTPEGVWIIHVEANCEAGAKSKNANLLSCLRKAFPTGTQERWLNPDGTLDGVTFAIPLPLAKPESRK